MSIAVTDETSGIAWSRRTHADELRRQLADDIVRGQLSPDSTAAQSRWIHSPANLPKSGLSRHASLGLSEAGPMSAIGT
jgi:hypothetical protein